LFLLPAIVGVIIILLISRYYLSYIYHLSESQDKFVFVDIHLNNKCPFSNRYFAVEVKGSDQKFDFLGSRLTVKLKEKSEIRLAISDAFPNFRYSDRYRQIRQKIVLEADCGQDRTMEEAFKSINKAFR
jgi:hypothetical protein